MAIPLVGSPAPAVNYGDLLIGDSRDFAAGIGNWTASGGAVTRDTNALYKLAGLSASLKWASAASGQTLSVPISGSFKKGVPYDFLLVALVEESPAGTRSWTMDFGLIGTDSVQFSASGSNVSAPYGSRLLVRCVRWYPSADRTGVTFRLGRTADATAETWHVLWARCARAVGAGLQEFQFPGATAHTDPVYMAQQFAGATRQVPYKIGTAGPQVQVNGDQITVEGRNPGSGTPQLVAYSSTGSDNTEAWIYAPHTTIGDRVQWGFQIEVGTDYVGLFISEKAADEIQMYPDYGDYYITLLDGSASSDTKGWRAADAAGNVTGLLSKAPWRTLAAAPSTPAEGECYYDSTTHKLRVWNGTAWFDLF